MILGCISPKTKIMRKVSTFLKAVRIMVNILTEDVEINIEDEKWRLYNLQGANSLTPFFYTVRGTRLLYYTTKFGEVRGMPGTVLSADYVQAVVAGFDEKSKRWLLGIQLMMDTEAKARFAELVRWPQGENEQYATEAHKAGRI